MDAPGAVLNPLTHELRKAGLSVVDLLVEVSLLVELKVRRVVFDL